MTLVERLRSGDPVLARRSLLAGAAGATLGAVALAVFVHPLAGLAALGALALGPFILRDVDLALLLLVAILLLLPFGAIPLGIGFNPTFLDFALLILYAIAVMRLVTRAQPRLHWPPLAFGVLLFIGLMLAAFVAGYAHGAPSRNQLRVFGEMMLSAGLFILVGNLVRDRAGLRRLFRMLIVLGCASAALGLGLVLLPVAWQVELLSLLREVDYPSGPAVLRFINDDPARLQRATGTAIDPNSFGGMLAVITVLLAPQLASRDPWIPRRPALLMLALLGLALLATVSRGSLVGLAAGLGVIGLARDRRLLAGVLLAGLLLLALAQVLPWTSAYMQHFTAGLLAEDRATQMRLGEYRDALRLIQRYPWLGVGFGEPGDADLYRGVSSLYLIVAETMGLLGLGAFLALMAAAALRLSRDWLRLPPGGLRALVLGCLAALAAALVSGIFDHYFFTYPHAFALLWLVLGMGVRAGELGLGEAGGGAGPG